MGVSAPAISWEGPSHLQTPDTASMSTSNNTSDLSCRQVMHNLDILPPTNLSLTTSEFAWRGTKPGGREARCRPNDGDDALLQRLKSSARVREACPGMFVCLPWSSRSTDFGSAYTKPFAVVLGFDGSTGVWSPFQPKYLTFERSAHRLANQLMNRLYLGHYYHLLTALLLQRALLATQDALTLLS